MSAKIVSSKKMSKSTVFHEIGNNELLFSNEKDCNVKNKFSKKIFNNLSKFRIAENEQNTSNTKKQLKKTKSYDCDTNFNFLPQKYDVNTPTSSKNIDCECKLNFDQLKNKKNTNNFNKMRYSISEAFLFQKFFRKDNNDCLKKNEPNSIKKSVSINNNTSDKTNEILSTILDTNKNRKCFYNKKVECNLCFNNKNCLPVLQQETKEDEDDIRINRRSLPVNTTFSTWLHLFLSRKKSHNQNRNSLLMNGLSLMKNSVSLCKLSILVVVF